MWARWCELTIGAWLAAAPWFLSVPPDGEWLGALDIACGIAVATCALLSWVHATAHAHFVSFAIALGLLAIGWTNRVPASAMHENHVVTGLVLATFALVPNRASSPPRTWCHDRP